MEPIPLGHLELQQPIDRGGRGEVWRARHIAQKLPVAVKVMSAERARDPQYRAIFREQVRAAARLDHPGIVTVLDYGEVPAGAAERSPDNLVSGCPYLVMELVLGHSLAERRAPLPWPELKEVLLALLDALAHAHARAVLHRDLKPSNILIASHERGPGRIRLVDFGIGHALDSHSRTGSPQLTMGSPELPMGTPRHTSPEQLRGRWRDHGPWTDLYGLGCVAFELAVGRPPFEGDTPSALAAAHLHDPPPSLPEYPHLPPDLQDWIHRLLAKRPAQRFQRAADAAWALTRLREPTPAMGRAVAPPLGRARAPQRTTRRSLAQKTGKRSMGWTLVLPEPESTWPGPSTTEADPLETSRSIAGRPAALDPKGGGRPSPPVPESWPGPRRQKVSAQLIGAGLSLFGLRALPMVDRRAELESIWRSLGIVRETGRPRALVLAGPSGVGKSRLVEQTTERAHELGAAWLLKAVHNELPGPADGLSAMVARHLRCVGLTRPKLLERTERLLREQQVTDPYEWHALAELMAAAPDPDRGGPHGREVAPVHFESPAQRYLLIRRLAERLGRDRPVVIWLDDVQWGIDGLAFARYLLAERGVDPCPALLLLTVRDDALVERPGATALLAEVLSLPSAAELRVQRLAGSDHGRLVRELIPLPPRLAEEVAARTAGSPLFAIQLVGDWVHRELLQATPEGFAPVPGATADLPNDLDDVWLDRIARLLSNVRRTGPSPSADDKASVAVGEVRAMAASHPPATDALEMAAALGREVPAAEWLAICRRSGIAAPSRLLETLLESRLAYPTEDSGWRFAHPMLRESLERQAREGGRWQTHNRACAGVIERLYPAGQSGRAARLARLRAQAGQLEAALRQFPVAFRDLADQSRDGEADALVDEWEAALQRLKAGPEDSRWGVCWLARASARRSQGQLDDAESWSEQAAAQAGTHGWPLVLAKAQRELARTALQRTHFAAASELFRQALPLFEARDDKLGMAQCLDGQAEAALCRGHLDESEMLNQRALPLFQEVGDQDGVSACLLRRGAILQHLGDLDEAERHFLGAKSLHEAAGRHRGVAVCVENLAETARLRGDHAAAERRHLEAERIHRAVGSAIETAAPDLAEPPLGSRRDA